jgi:prepilin-type N-terminal cleavage/methylation domain-containing protein
MRKADESGLTLPELLVVMLVFGMVATLSVQATLMLSRGVQATASTANSIAQVRLALSSMERQVRSGNVLSSPANEVSISPDCQAYGTTAGSCIRLYTQASSVGLCVQWQVLADPAAPGLALMRTRTFAPTWQTGGAVEAWRTVARGLTVPSAAAPPFTLQGAATPFNARLLDVTLTAPDSAQNGRAVTLTSSLSGRNTTYGYDTALCSSAPA